MSGGHQEILNHRHWLSVSEESLVDILDDEENPLKNGCLTEIEKKVLCEYQMELKDLNRRYRNEEQWFYFYIFFYLIVLVLIPPLGLLSAGAAFYVKNKQDKMKRDAKTPRKYRDDFIHKLSPYPET